MRGCAYSCKLVAEVSSTGQPGKNQPKLRKPTKAKKTNPTICQGKWSCLTPGWESKTLRLPTLKTGRKLAFLEGTLPLDGAISELSNQETPRLKFIYF
jgi:hypothetical protein